MQECQPIPTLRAFLDSRLNYIFPAPGGSLADGSVRSNDPADLYLAALASKAKRRIVKTATVDEYLRRHLEIVQQTKLFDTVRDVKIAERIMSWLRELAS